MTETSIRTATLDDREAIARVIRESLAEIGPAVYTPEQVASSLRYIARPDEELIRDGTYFVAVAGEEITGCGGWSRHRKLYSGSAASAADHGLLDPARDPARIRAMFVRPAWVRKGIGRSILALCERRAAAEGFQRVHLVAMLSGEAMYAACGYVALSSAPIVLEDGTTLACTLMEKVL